MRINYETCIAGAKCILVPYRPQHVATYHEWMKDPDLLEATGSEPLSLQEEVEMQQSWKNDPDKCTFIVLARDHCIECPPAQESASDFVVQNLSAMVGDVNLFLSETEDENDNEPTVVETEQSTPRIQAELDIMIAEHNFRGKGLGREASCLMMLYGAQMLSISRLYCKIKETNTASRNLFESLGFTQCNYAECFREVELELMRDTPQELADAIIKHAEYVDMVHWPCPLEPAESIENEKEDGEIEKHKTTLFLGCKTVSSRT